MKKAGRYLLLTALPLGVLIALIAYYAADTLYWDEWDMFRLLDKFYNNTLTFQDIFMPHNAHRMVWAKILILINAVYFRWNLYLEIAMNVLFAVGTSIIIFYAVEKMDFLDSKKRNVLYFTSACLIFSFSQHINYMWGFQMAIFMSVFFDLLAVYLLVYGGTVGFFGAMVSGFFATFSFGSGVVIWPIGLLLLLFMRIAHNNNGRWGRKIVLWLVFSAINICLCLHGGFASQNSLLENVQYIFFHPHEFIILFTCYLGAPIAVFRQSVALAAGLGGLMLQAYSFVNIIRARKFDKSLLFWIGADLYVLCSAAVTALARHSNISATMTRRYVSISMIFWAATFVIFAYALECRHKSPLKKYLLFAAIVLPLSLSEENLLKARNDYEARMLFNEQMKQGIYDNEHYLAAIFPFRSGAERIPLLRKYGIKNFENAPEKIEFNDFQSINFAPEYAAVSPISSFGIDSTSVRDLGFYTVKGWWKVDAFNKAERQDARSSLILYDGSHAFEAAIETDRNRSAKDFRLKRYNELSSMLKRQYFTANQLYIKSLPAGTYQVFLKVQGRNSDYYYAPLKKIVTVE